MYLDHFSEERRATGWFQGLINIDPQHEQTAEAEKPKGGLEWPDVGRLLASSKHDQSWNAQLVRDPGWPSNQRGWLSLLPRRLIVVAEGRSRSL